MVDVTGCRGRSTVLRVAVVPRRMGEGVRKKREREVGKKERERISEERKRY